MVTYNTSRFHAYYEGREMASLQARHTRSCALGRPWTRPEDATGCTCKKGPAFYIVSRDEAGKLQRDPVGHNRKNAERALRKVEHELDEGTYQPQRTVRFADWADQWLGSLQRKQTTIASYISTIDHAKATFGTVVVRKLTPGHIARMDARMRAKGLSASTRAKHLRVLGSCLSSAVAHGFAASNPVKALPKAERPRPERKESAYFTDAELPRLIAAVPPGVYQTLCLTALRTGCRKGELSALTWGDVDLLGATLRVRRTLTDGHLSTPKNHEIRDVPLTAEAVDLLGRWWGECGQPGTDALVFASAGGYLDGGAILDVLYAAMAEAGIERIGPTGERRTFHSFRHTFARIALERGAPLFWVSRHLGHSSESVTDRSYGHFAPESRRAEMARLEGAFTV